MDNYKYVDYIYKNNRVIRKNIFNIDDKNIIALRFIYNDNESSNWIYLGKRLSVKDIKNNIENPYYKMMIPLMKERNSNFVCLTNHNGLIIMGNNDITYEEYIKQILRDICMNNNYRFSFLVSNSYKIIVPSMLDEWLNLVYLNKDNMRYISIMGLSLLLLDYLNNGNTIESIKLSINKDILNDTLSIVKHFSKKDLSLVRK